MIALLTQAYELEKIALMNLSSAIPKITLNGASTGAQSGIGAAVGSIPTPFLKSGLGKVNQSVKNTATGVLGTKFSPRPKTVPSAISGRANTMIRTPSLMARGL